MEKVGKERCIYSKYNKLLFQPLHQISHIELWFEFFWRDLSSNRCKKYYKLRPRICALPNIKETWWIFAYLLTVRDRCKAASQTNVMC